MVSLTLSIAILGLGFGFGFANAFQQDSDVDVISTCDTATGKTPSCTDEDKAFMQLNRAIDAKDDSDMSAKTLIQAGGGAEEYTTTTTTEEYTTTMTPEPTITTTTEEHTTTTTPEPTTTTTTECDETFSPQNAVDYRGCQNFTISGRTCQKWTVLSPLTLPAMPEAEWVSAGLGDHNFCRNMGKGGTDIWCYTMDPNQRWENCAAKIPECGFTKRANWRVMGSSHLFGPFSGTLDQCKAKCCETTGCKGFDQKGSKCYGKSVVSTGNTGDDEDDWDHYDLIPAPRVHHTTVSGAFACTTGADCVRSEKCTENSATTIPTSETGLENATIGVTCCDKDGVGTRPGCVSGNYELAESTCLGESLELCDAQQIKAGSGEREGCHFDHGMVWTKTLCSVSLLSTLQVVNEDGSGMSAETHRIVQSLM